MAAVEVTRHEMSKAFAAAVEAFRSAAVEVAAAESTAFRSAAIEVEVEVLEFRNAAMSVVEAAAVEEAVEAFRKSAVDAFGSAQQHRS